MTNHNVSSDNHINNYSNNICTYCYNNRNPHCNHYYINNEVEATPQSLITYRSDSNYNNNQFNRHRYRNSQYFNYTDGSITDNSSNMGHEVGSSQYYHTDVSIRELSNNNNNNFNYNNVDLNERSDGALRTLSDYDLSNIVAPATPVNSDEQSINSGGLYSSAMQVDINDFSIQLDDTHNDTSSLIYNNYDMEVHRLYSEGLVEINSDVLSDTVSIDNNNDFTAINILHDQRRFYDDEATPSQSIHHQNNPVIETESFNNNEFYTLNININHYIIDFNNNEQIRENNDTLFDVEIINQTNFLFNNNNNIDIKIINCPFCRKKDIIYNWFKSCNLKHYCNICMEDDKLMSIGKCGHSLCVDCLDKIK